MITLFKPTINCFSSNCLDAISENFGNRNYNLLLYKRPIDDSIVEYIHWLYDTSFHKLELDLHQNGLRNQLLEEVKDKLPYSDKVSPTALLEDIYFLAQSFMTLSRSSRLKLHLRVITDDACRKFHVDGCENRCICTYDGPGTEWLMEDNGRRKDLGTENYKIVKNPKKIRQMNAFEVGFLKGENFKNPDGKGIIHRSPAIESKGLKRFVVRLDV